MLKRVLGITLGLLVVGLLVIIGAGIWLTESSLPAFAQNGYVLQSGEDSVKQVIFSADENYKVTKLGVVTFTDASGETASVEQRSFLHLDGGAVSAFSDGVLLDFNDLSANFINNYYITEGVEITSSGEGYTAQTNSGTLTFGDHLWKLSDDRYMVQSSELTVHFSDEDERAVSGYVEVRVTEDGIVQLLTEENQWSTISEECYIQTASGVKIYPITQIVENDEYKMSLAKLAVNTDDSIVLTEDETRRQIVPELNITGVDGEDGSDGDVGAQGEAGMMGGGGETGSSGQTGQNGTSGKGGASGAAGGNGAAGDDALTESTVNSALPTMSITEWEVTATTLRGEITVKDESGSLTEVVGSGANSYDGTVTIYNQDTGEVISCFPIADLGENTWPDDFETNAGFIEFANGQTEICFATKKNALEPDTTYRLSVVAYYQMNDMIYSREFINRIFYTDSTGVILSKHTAEANALTVNSSIAQAYQNSVKSVQVFLLTPEQNAGFNLASVESGTNYQGKYVLDYQAGTISRFGPGGSGPENPGGTLEPDMVLNFPDLESNTKYIARVYVETDAGLKTLTSQELELQTLKTPPTWTAGDKPKASYNRATGTFEVYRPTVTDLDSGIVSFIYTAYDQAGNPVRSQKVEPARGEPITFSLESGKQYTFKVEAVFNDNEKEVTYDLGTSDPVQSYGDQLPHITLTPVGEPSSEYNKFTGDLTIQLTSASSELVVSESQPLTLSFYADSLNSGDLAFEITLTDNNPVAVGDEGKLGTATYSRQASNYPTVKLDLINLYKNTNYTIVVSGWLNLGDGKGVVYQTIGTTGFRTYAPINLAATWSTPSESTGTAISRNLKLSAANTTEDKDREAYALNELRSGSVRLELYNGTGVNKVRIAYTDITSTTQLEQLYGSAGIDITENTFGGSLTLSPSVDYTLVVTTVTDATYSMALGYQNIFDSVANANLPITAQATPPDLLSNPAQGVKVTPIYNEDAPKYGAKYDETQPDELLIGYRLESTYDNVQRLGYDVTYYALEYSEFYNALLSGKDPIQNANHLIEATQRISAASDTVPSVAFLFGGTKTEDKDAQFINNCYVYYTGEDQLTSGALSGMGRGYRYTFAYTVRYSTTGNFDESQLSVYPYGHADYTAYKAAYGAGQQFGKVIGQNSVYVLNSGMYEAPRMDPEIHTMVYQTKSSEDSLGLATSGTITIQYKYRDVDGTINDTGTFEEKTKVTWVDADGITQTCAINDTKATYDTDTGIEEVGDGWWQVDIPYRIAAVGNQPATGMITPQLEISRYGIDYTEIMKDLTEGTAWEDQDTDTFYLCQVPVDWAWDDRFANYGSQIQVEADLSNMAGNIITFRVKDTVGGGAAAATIAERLYAMKLTFSYQDGKETVTTDPIYLPVSVGVDGRPYAELATGRIANLVGKTIRYTAELLYDNGELGWALVDGDDAMFALQMINGTGEESNTFGFESYLSSVTGGTGASPSGAVAVHDGGNNHLSLKRLYNGLNDLNKPAKTYGVTRYLTSATNAAVGRYFYIDHYGMDISTDSSVDLLTGRYAVPKGCAVLSVPSAGDGQFQLTSITPAIAMGNYRATTTKLEVSPNFTIDGAANADPAEGEEENIRIVYMGVFASQEDAQGLKNPITSGPVRVAIDEKGTAKPVDQSTNLVLEGLEAGKTYWLAVCMMIDGQPTVLMDAQSAQRAIYRFTAVDDVVIESAQEMVYYNNSYFEKFFKMNYTITPFLGFEAHYAIYASEGNYESQTPIYSGAELDSILTAPKNLTTSNCELTLNLEPSQLRNKLVPGGTYYLRIYVTEQGGEDIVGENTFKFTISPVGNTGALIYAQNATSDALTFQVTLSDAQFSYMGRKEGSTETDEGALYAVRFTAKNGEKEYRLLTTYDEELYSSADLQKSFVLSADCLTASNLEGQKIDQATEYTMHVFAVPDFDHDGLVETDEAGSEDQLQNYEWFFGDEDNFQKMINRIWDDQGGSYTELDSMKWIKKRYEVGLKTQQTTDSEGILINEKMASILRVGTNTLQLNLAESYGVVTIDENNQARQSFPLVKWSVTGLNVPTFLSGESRVSAGDKIFTRTTDAQGYEVYTYDIPAQVTSGNYLITVQLYRSEDASAPYKTLSLTYRG